MVLVTLLLAGSATAATPIEATIEPAGTMLVTQAEGQGSVVGAYTTVTDSWNAQCATLTVTRYETRAVRTANLEFVTASSNATYRVHDATLRIARTDSVAWLGIYSPPRSLTASASGTLALDAVAETVIGNGPTTPERTPNYGYGGFSLAFDGGWLLADAHDIDRIDGDMMSKISGARIEIHARENTSLLDTIAPAPTATERVRRWATLACGGDEASMGGMGAGQVVLAHWRAQDVRGFEAPLARGLVSHGASEDPIEERALVVTGLFDLDLDALSPEHGPTVGLSFLGDARSASFASAPVSAIAGRNAPWLLLGIALALGAGAGAAGVIAIRRRAGAPTMSLDELIDLANQAGAEGRFELGLTWVERALALAPEHPRLLADRGYFLSQVGRTDEAIVAYRAAAKRGKDGEAEILLARLLCNFSDSPPEARDAVGAALRKEPLLLLDVEDDPKLAWTLDARENAQAVRDARRALDDA